MLAAALALLLAGTLRADEQDTHNAIERIALDQAVDLRHHHHHVSLSVNVSEVKGASAWARVEWSGVRHPSFDDWIGVLAPADAHVKHSTPVKYKLATNSPSHLDDGSGWTTCGLLCTDLQTCRLALFEYSPLPTCPLSNRARNYPDTDCGSVF